MTSRIRKVFNSQEGLTGIVAQLPLDTRFQLENVKVVSLPAGRSVLTSHDSAQWLLRLVCLEGSYASANDQRI